MEAGDSGFIEILINRIPSLVARHTAEVDLVAKIAADAYSVRAFLLFLGENGRLLLFGKTSKILYGFDKFRGKLLESMGFS